jgi:hypothetical protein
MPKIYEYFGIIFLINSNDHLPLHCHIRIDDTEGKAVMHFYKGVLTSVEIENVTGIKPIDKKYHKDIKKFIKYYANGIALKWFQYSILKQEVVNEKITTKIK